MPICDLSSSALSPSPQFIVGPTTDATSPALRVGKVLHVINGEHFSGAERVQQLLGKRLPLVGFDAEFVCVKPDKFASLCGLRANQVCELPMRGRLDMSVVAAIANKATAESFDLLHAHTPRTALVTSLASLRSGIPWVYHVHSPTARDSTRGMINRVNEWIERYSIRSCHKLLTVSKSLRREMLRLGVSHSRLALVPNGVPAIEPIDAASRLAEPNWRIGMIALMRPRKGVEVALEAMRELKQRRLPIKLDLIGGFESQAYEAQILGLLRSMHLEDTVRWTGFTNDIPATIRQLDALVLPSLFGEGMPMVVLEALAAAVPVVATRVEGTPEVIRDGIEGLLAEPRNAASLTEKLMAVTASRHEWQQLSQNALARHRSAFTADHMAEHCAKAYRRVLQARAGD